MKKLSFLMSMLLVVIGLGIGWSSTAAADTTSRVTPWEYHHVYLTDTQRRVERIFDSRGRWVYEYYDRLGVGRKVKEYKGEDGAIFTFTYIHPPKHGRWRLIDRNKS